jgi:hypothetical protein
VGGPAQGNEERSPLLFPTSVAEGFSSNSVVISEREFEVSLRAFEMFGDEKVLEL